jgi:hypothetical protein
MNTHSSSEKSNIRGNTRCIVIEKELAAEQIVQRCGAERPFFDRPSPDRLQDPYSKEFL